MEALGEVAGEVEAEAEGGGWRLARFRPSRGEPSLPHGSRLCLGQRKEQEKIEEEEGKEEGRCARFNNNNDDRRRTLRFQLRGDNRATSDYDKLEREGKRTWGRHGNQKERQKEERNH